MSRYKWMITGSLLATLLLGGCGENQNLTSEDVVTKMLEANKTIGSYYAEGYMVEYEGDKKVSEHTFAEWQDAATGKRRFEVKNGNDLVQSLNDGKQVITYDQAHHTAFSVDVSDTGDLGMGSPKEQLISMLDKVRNTHKIEVMGEEEVNGQSAYHVKASVHDKKSLMGDMELWADLKTWQVLKSSYAMGESKMSFAYTKMDKSPQFREDTFVLHLPKDVKVTPIADVNPAKKVSVEEGQKALKAPFLYMNAPGLDLAEIELNEWKGELNRNELTLSYMKQDVPYFTLSVFPTPKEAEDEAGMPGEKPMKVRGIEGTYMEEIRAITWDENGLRYTLLIQHPDLTVDEMLQLTTEMKWSNNK